MAERLEKFVSFSGKIMMSTNGIVSVPVNEFKYAVPRTFSFSKHGCSFELLVKTQGYTAADSVKLASLSFPRLQSQY